MVEERDRGWRDRTGGGKRQGGEIGLVEERDRRWRDRTGGGKRQRVER